MAAKKHKDWFDKDCTERLGHAIAKNYQAFDISGYAEEVDAGVPPLELKDRIFLMAKGLKARLPADYPKTCKILEASLGPPLAGETGMFTEGYWLMPVARFVEEFGHEYFDDSMRLAAQVTRRHTSEYAVRPYIVAQTDRALALFATWVRSEDLHIRRLASEGVRPRLPWAKKLDIFIADPEPVLALVEPLMEDPSKYVRASVANLINDVSRDHPDRVIDLLKRWKKANAPETEWILKHGARTLRKKGLIPQ